MSVSIDIVPLSDSLDMYGEPDPSFAFSLSGHVSISLDSTTSFFERRRTLHLLLQSLTITFEGQSELVTPAGGYSPLRLCSYTRDLAPNEPVELSNEGHEESDKPCTWNVVFDIPVSNWLPASSIFGDASPEEGGIRYALYATAKFVNMDDSNSGKTWSFSSLCASFRSKVKTVHAQKCPIILRRFINPPTTPSSTSLFPLTTYLVRARSGTSDASHDSTSIPPHILNKVRVLASVPQYVDIQGPSDIPFSLRLRTEDLDDVESKRLRVSGFSVEIEQSEKYYFLLSSERWAQYSLPSQSSQPPHEPLLSPHSFNTLFELGLLPRRDSANVLTRSFSLIPSEQSGKYELAGSGYIFAKKDSEPSTTPPWYSMESTVPFAQRSSTQEKNWAGELVLRENTTSPHFTVCHKLHIALNCTYDVPDSTEQVSEKMHFSLPLHFARVTPPPPPPSPSHSPTSSIFPMDSIIADMLKPSAPYAQSLPAYSQLYDANGERKIDYSVPLPLYTPRSHASSSSDTLELDATSRGSFEKELAFDMEPLLEVTALTSV